MTKKAKKLKQPPKPSLDIADVSGSLSSEIEVKVTKVYDTNGNWWYKINNDR